jgi:hypothetical protein
MRESEARWIAERLAEYPIEHISPLLNIGSSTGEFRERKQPHIEALIFKPLRAKGVEVVHTDLKEQPGVDVAGDLLDPEVQRRLRGRGFKSAISSNMLEHVRDPAPFARAIASLVEPKGLVLVTVPRSYPFHADPIDTMFRPTPDELAQLFAGTKLVRGDIVVDTTYADELRRQSPRRVAKSLLNTLRPRGDIGRAQRDKLRWLFKPFTTSCVVLETATS